jgi:hypothetical protein
MIIKFKGAEISISSANTVSNSALVRVINTGASANLIISGTGNVTITNTQPVIIEKSPTATLTGANMLAAPIAYKN